jgi:uncharacterized protein YraI
MLHHLLRSKLLPLHRTARIFVLVLVVSLSLLGGLLLTPPSTARADTGSNWTGSYYSNTDLFGSPVFLRIDPAVVFNWGPNPPGLGIGSQNWSARWQAIQYFNAGTYRFTVTADDGVRVFINGQLIINEWRVQAPTTFSVNAQLPSGNHALQVEYFQGAGDAQIAFSWNPVQVQSSAWTAQYYNNTDLIGIPAITRYEGQINYNWGLGAPANGVAADNFSVRWTATVPFNAGTYRFTLGGNDGVRLFIDDILIINQWRDQAFTNFSIDMHITGGLHTLRIEYYERNVEAAVRFNYEIAVGPPGGYSDSWYAEYFGGNQTLSGVPNFVRYEGPSGLNRVWTNEPLSSGVRENFSARWTRRACGFGRPSLFTLHVDDGARLFIDNYLVIDAWRATPNTVIQQVINLSPGCHIFRVEYFQVNGPGFTFFTWNPPDGQNPPLYFGGTTPPPSGAVNAVVDFVTYLNVRTGPGISYGVITQVTRGTTMTLVERNADATWVRGTATTGVSGWVSSAFVRATAGNILSLPVFTSPPPPPPPVTIVRGKLTSGLRLRTGPGTVYPFSTILEWGTVVDIIGRSRDGQWVQVRYSSLNGWIYRPYVVVVSGNLNAVPIIG